MLKADWIGVVIVLVPFEEPKIKVSVFDRATLSGFATREFLTKEDLNTKKEVLLLITLRPEFT